MRKRTQLILVDLLNGALISERTVVFGHYSRPNLKLPFLVEQSESDKINTSSAQRLIRKMQRRKDWQESHLVVGIETDPLYPFVGKFEVMVRCFELIADCPPAFLTIQTRSPLIVLALPLLKRLAAKLKVVFAIEAINDSLNQQYTPHLARPSERITAARTLHRFGIDVQLQVAPIVGGRSQLKGLSRRALSQFVRECNSAARTVEIVPVTHLVGEDLSPMIVNSHFGGEFQKVSHLAMREVCRAELTAAELVITPELMSEVAA